MDKIKSSLKYIIPLTLAIVLIWFVLGKINFDILWGRISSANLTWVSIGILISIAAHLSRAYRWNILLEPLGYTPSLKNTFIAVMVGYFGNIFLPRGGEVMRCMVLTKVDNVPFNTSFGTVVAERAFDFACLLFLMGCALLLEFERFRNFLTEFIFNKKNDSTTSPIYQNPYVLTLLILSVLVFILFLIYRDKIVKSSVFIKARAFIAGIIKGVLSIRHLKRIGAFFFHTFIIWVCYFLMTYLMFFSLPATSGLGVTAGLVILIVGGLGMSAPVSGGIGPFHLMVAGALQYFYGLQQDDGLAYAFVTHTSQLISLLIIGGLCSLIVLIIGKKKQDGKVPVKN